MTNEAQKPKWTQVYADNKPTGLVWYVRLVPDFMNLEATGWSHGIPIGNLNFPTKTEADAYSEEVEKFFNQMLVEHKEEIK